jgi:endonuclease YncB( thermonuclease family)
MSPRTWVPAVIVLIGLIVYFLVVAPSRNQSGFTYNPSTPTSSPNPSSVSQSNPRANPQVPNPPATPIKTVAGAFRFIKGAFKIIGKEPDGDSVRFIPDNPQFVRELKNSSRVKFSSDGSVQLRFEAIDAPELHFGQEAQPLGAESRDALLKLMGFSGIQYTSAGLQVSASNPDRVRGAILSTAAEANGRPVSYVLLERDAAGLKDGSSMGVDANILRRTMNFKMLENGLAYLTVYTTTPESHRVFLRGVSAAARQAKKGVWAVDKTSDFSLDNQDSIGERGQLILPKLFRRATSYVQDRAKGKFNGSLPQWVETSVQRSQSQNDAVSVGGSGKRLSDLIRQQGRRVQFRADVLDLVFGN